jgi:integrase
VAERKRLGLREVRALEPGQTIWDGSLPGFGARRQHSTAVAYVLLYRTLDGRQRFHTIGRHGAPWTPDTARERARKLLGEVVNGGDPSADKKARRHAETITELCDLYWTEVESGRLLTRRAVPKKPSTLISDRSRIEGHIKPLLGKLRVAAVTREDVEAFMHDVAAGKTAARKKTAKPKGLSRVRGGKGTASRAVGLLGAVFAFAIKHRMRQDNPAHGIMRPADGVRERRLSEAEYAAFGQAFRRAEAGNIWPPAIAAARFLLLTGWRSGEALTLRWADVDVSRRTAILPDTKTGRSIRPLSQAACDVLAGAPRLSDLVFPAVRSPGRMISFPYLWMRICRGLLPADITPHVLRHSFASLASDLGYSEPTIAALVGHKGLTVTSRYIHSADAVLLAAADDVAGRILDLAVR